MDVQNNKAKPGFCSRFPRKLRVHFLDLKRELIKSRPLFSPSVSDLWGLIQILPIRFPLYVCYKMDRLYNISRKF